MDSGCQTMSEVSTLTDKEQLTEPGIKVANFYHYIIRNYSSSIWTGAVKNCDTNWHTT